MDEGESCTCWTAVRSFKPANSSDTSDKCEDKSSTKSFKDLTSPNNWERWQWGHLNGSLDLLIAEKATLLRPAHRLCIQSRESHISQ